MCPGVKCRTAMSRTLCAIWKWRCPDVCTITNQMKITIMIVSLWCLKVRQLSVCLDQFRSAVAEFLALDYSRTEGTKLNSFYFCYKENRHVNKRKLRAVILPHFSISQRRVATFHPSFFTKYRHLKCRRWK